MSCVSGTTSGAASVSSTGLRTLSSAVLYFLMLNFCPFTAPLRSSFCSAQFGGRLPSSTNASTCLIASFLWRTGSVVGSTFEALGAASAVSCASYGCTCGVTVPLATCSACRSKACSYAALSSAAMSSFLVSLYDFKNAVCSFLIAAGE